MNNYYYNQKPQLANSLTHTNKKSNNRRAIGEQKYEELKVLDNETQARTLSVQKFALRLCSRRWNVDYADLSEVFHVLH